MRPLPPMHGLFRLALCLWASAATAQHSHGILTPGVTFPQDDAVLMAPPHAITMSFRVPVRLLKLALYTAEGEWIDIGFRYEPDRYAPSFVYPVTRQLPPSVYYVTQWSVADADGRLRSGEFRFAFGAGALPPSETIASRVSDLEEQLPDTGSYRRGQRNN